MRKQRSVLERLRGLIPILEWLPRYDVKRNLSGDLVGGLTVGIMHVPQGMAYASLAGVPPVHGMYSSFFAAFVYMFFGTARHISIGVFAVASMMVGAVRLRFLPGLDESAVGVNGTAIEEDTAAVLELLSALTLAVGIVQLVLGLLPLAFVTTYMSDQLVSGFTTGSAAHVLTSQLNKVIGVKLPRHEGIGLLPKMLYDLALSLPKTNFVALGISLAGMTFLHLGRLYVNPPIEKKFRVPVPLELLLVIAGTIASVVFSLEEKHHIKVVSHIPRGLPSPSLPNFSLIPSLIPDAVPIAIVCLMFILSMGKLFAKKHRYRTDSTQEFLAAGLMEVFSSFFPVYPVGASLSRSAVCEMSGAKTQLYTVFSSALLLVVILFIGPLLEPLPMCILACIVIVSLKSLFMQVTELPRLWRISKFDFAIWVVSCVSTIVTDVTRGLVISVLFVLFTVVLRQQWPRFADVTESSSESELKELATPSSNVKVLRFLAPLHFANAGRFVDKLTNEINREEKEDALIPASRVLVVDCSSISSIDAMAIDAFKDVYNEAKRSNVTLYFASLNEHVLTVLESVDFYKTVPKTTFTATVKEAVDRGGGSNDEKVNIEIV